MGNEKDSHTLTQEEISILITIISHVNLSGPIPELKQEIRKYETIMSKLESMAQSSQ